MCIRDRPKSPALPQRIPYRAMMAAYCTTSLIQKVAVRIPYSSVLFQKMRIIAVRHKADILAVMLSGVDEAKPLRKGPDLLLLQLAQGELCMGQLFLRHSVEHVALIFMRILSLIHI